MQAHTETDNLTVVEETASSTTTTIKYMCTVRVHLQARNETKLRSRSVQRPLFFPKKRQVRRPGSQPRLRGAQRDIRRCPEKKKIENVIAVSERCVPSQSITNYEVLPGTPKFDIVCMYVVIRRGNQIALDLFGDLFSLHIQQCSLALARKKTLESKKIRTRLLFL